MLSDTDIKKQLEERRNNPDKGISIAPFEEKYLTPVGYDLRIGKRGFSWKNKFEINIERERQIEIEPSDTVVIETLESVSLSKEFGATIHSMVTRVTLQGLSHISTTIDPGWTGKLLISFHNYRDSSVELRLGDAFCTVCFYRVESESRVSLGRPVDRDDIWEQLLDIARQKKQRKNRENKIRIGSIGGLVLIALIFVTQISLKNPDLGTYFVTILAAISPIVYDQLKPR